jgi:hypothetical protein
MRALMRQVTEYGFKRLVAGIHITNVGGAPFHVAALHCRAYPGPLWVPDAWRSFEGPPTIPADIPPGGQMTYWIDLAVLKGQQEVAEQVHGCPQQMGLEVWSGKKRSGTPPIPNVLLDFAGRPFIPERPRPRGRTGAELGCGARDYAAS